MGNGLVLLANAILPWAKCTENWGSFCVTVRPTAATKVISIFFFLLHNNMTKLFLLFWKASGIIVFGARAGDKGRKL